MKAFSKKYVWRYIDRPAEVQRQREDRRVIEKIASVRLEYPDTVYI